MERGDLGELGLQWAQSTTRCGCGCALCWLSPWYNPWGVHSLEMYHIFPTLFKILYQTFSTPNVPTPNFAVPNPPPPR